MVELIIFVIYLLIQIQIDFQPLLVLYILIISVVVFIIYKRRKLNLEKRKKEQEKIMAKKQKEYNLLNQEKKVICDDGVERIYRANMFGIIEEKIDEQHQWLDCMNNPDIFYSESPELLAYYNDKYIKLGIEYYNWYSETGNKLNTTDEIKKADIKFRIKYDKYYYKYISNHKIKLNHSLASPGSMIVINDFVFFQNWGKSLYVFSGKILGKKINKGKLVDEDDSFIK